MCWIRRGYRSNYDIAVGEWLYGQQFKKCRRDFRKGNYKEIRKSLAHIDWNDKMKNKTATECWNILRGEIDSAIDSFVPMKRQGKR